MTEEQYIEELEQLDAAGCKHPLWPLVKRGYSPANAIYLRQILSEIPETVEIEEKTEVSTDLKVLIARKQRIQGERAALSNKMVSLPEGDQYNSERAKYSDYIQEKQRQIKSVMREINLIEQGFTPLQVEAQRPMSEGNLIRKLQSLRASRSRKRGQQNALSGDALKKCLADIDELNNRIQDVEQSLRKD